MTEKREYREFRELLRKAMGTQSQKAFAEACGLSPEHMNRLLNNPVISRPSKATLLKILNASGQVDGSELYRSCDYSVEDSNMDVWRKRKGLPVKKQLDLTAELIQSKLQAMQKRIGIYSSLEELVHTFLHEIAPVITRVRKVNSRDWMDSGNKYRRRAVCCIGCWQILQDATYTLEVETWFVLFYELLSNGNVILMDSAVDMETLSHWGFLPEPYLEQLYEDGEDIKELPSFSTVTRKVKTKPSAEEQLLRTLFGDPDEVSLDLRYWKTGRGSVWKETPSRFVEYVLENEAYFSVNEEEQELLEEMRDVGALTKELEEELLSYGFGDSHGTPAIALAILNRKAKAAGHSFDVEFDVSVEHTDVLAPVLYVSDDACMHAGSYSKELLQEVDGWLKPELAAMGLLTYGDTNAYVSVSVPVKDLLEGQQPM